MDELLVTNGFTAYSKEMNLENINEIFHKIYDEGYFDELKDRLEDENIDLKMDIMKCGTRLDHQNRQIGSYKIFFEGMSKNTYQLDTEEIINIFYNITDDFQDLQLKFYNCLF